MIPFALPAFSFVRPFIDGPKRKRLSLRVRTSNILGIARDIIVCYVSRRRIELSLPSRPANCRPVFVALITAPRRFRVYGSDGIARRALTLLSNFPGQPAPSRAQRRVTLVVESAIEDVIAGSAFNGPFDMPPATCCGALRNGRNRRITALIRAGHSIGKAGSRFAEGDQSRKPNFICI